MPERMLRDWTQSEAVDALSAEAEVFFTRLIMKADDYGNYVGHPKLLRAALYPLRDMHDNAIEASIVECVAAGVIKTYQVDGKRYINIPNYGQRLRQMKGKYPAPDGNPPTNVRNPPTNVVEGKRREGKIEEKMKVDFAFASQIASLLNKPYPKERGMDGAGQDVDMILAQLSHKPNLIEEIKAMKAYFIACKWNLPKNPATIVTNLIDNDYPQMIKELDPEVQDKIKQDARPKRKPEADTIGTSAPGSLE